MTDAAKEQQSAHVRLATRVKTWLSTVCYHETNALMERMIMEGVDVNLCIPGQYTALHRVAMWNAAPWQERACDRARMLLLNRADPTVLTRHGHSALDFAVTSKNDALARILHEALFAETSSSRSSCSGSGSGASVI